MIPTTQRRIVLAKRPIGEPVEADFRLEAVPTPEPQHGEVLVRALYLSLDPYMRGRISDGPSYAKPVEIGEVMVGATVSRVEVSQHPDFVIGQLVVGY